MKRRIMRTKTLILTFDDGPSSKLTPAILDLLLEYRVKGSFFLLGKNITGCEHIVRRIAAEGHDICSHGYEHLCHWDVSPLRSLRDIEQGWQAIDNALGSERQKYSFRPPNGKLNIISLLYLFIKKVPVYYWSVVSGDTWPQENRDPRRIAEAVKRDGGAVALLHDFHRSDPGNDVFVLEAVRIALQTAMQSGVQMKTMNEFFQF